MKQGQSVCLLAAVLVLLPMAARADTASLAAARPAAAPSTPAAASTARPRAAFSDVPPNHWAYDAVNELAALGILVGYPAAPAPPPRGNGAPLARPAPKRTRPAPGSAAHRRSLPHR